MIYLTSFIAFTVPMDVEEMPNLFSIEGSIAEKYENDRPK
jgi:hypothetical protein